MAFVDMKPGTLLAPVPAVLISCAAEGVRPNAMTAAWAGTVNSEPPMVSVSVRPERWSYHIIRESGEFVVNLCGEALLRATDYCGVRSGRDGDKLAACGLTTVPVRGLKWAPAIARSPLYLGCRVRSVTELGSHHLFVGEIMAMGVRDDLLDEKGKIHFERAKLIAYNHGVYYGLGQALGFFGYSVAAPDVLRRRMKELSAAE